jgi:DNA adenine methylase
MVLRPPVKWHGGKHYLARKIISLFPEHRIYLEPFGGAASVLLNKSPVQVEAYNDLDRRISRLFRILQTQGTEFVERLRFVPYSEFEFNEAVMYPENAIELDMAVCDFIRWRQSFGGQGKSWSYTTKRARGGMAGDVNAWWTAVDQLPEIISRLKRVQILCQPALKAIKRFDDEECLIYCDPPYLPETRDPNSRDVYGIEMTVRDHEELASLLLNCRSNVAVSGYPSKLYDRLYRNWNKITFDIANHASGAETKDREFEVLWFNW